MRALGAEVRGGDVRDGHAQGRGQRGDARLGHERRDDPLRPRLGDGPAPVPDDRPRPPAADRRRGRGPARRPSRAGCPDLAIACVGGGSNAIGLLARFIGEPTVRLAVVEAAGDGMETGRHAAAILGGTPGILHGSRSLMLQDATARSIEAHSASAGLDYPGIGPQLAALAEGGRIEVAAATDREAVAAMKRRPGPRGSSPRSRRHTRSRHCPSSGRRRRAGRLAGPTRSSSCSGSPVAATRTSRRSSGSPTSSRGTAPGDRRRGAGALPLAARDDREGDLGRRPRTRATRRSACRTRSS